MTDEAKALVEIYWEAMNLGRANKEIDMDPEDGWVNEQAAELAKSKALAETLAGALELYAQWGGDTAREALREYKEARDV